MSSLKWGPSNILLDNRELNGMRETDLKYMQINYINLCAYFGHYIIPILPLVSYADDYYYFKCANYSKMRTVNSSWENAKNHH